MHKCPHAIVSQESSLIGMVGEKAGYIVLLKQIGGYFFFFALTPWVISLLRYDCIA